MGNTCCSSHMETPNPTSMSAPSVHMSSQKSFVVPSPKFTITETNLSITSITAQHHAPSTQIANRSEENMEKINDALKRIDRILQALGPTFINEYHKLHQPNLPTLGPFVYPNTNHVYYGQFHNSKREGLGT